MESIHHQFQKSLNKIKPYADKNFLLTVSGGVDSMVLVHLFQHFQLRFSVAHCNFQLRGNDSDLDEQFIKTFCTQNQIELFTQKFNVSEFKKTGNFSTQMAARELRYDWFFKLKEIHQFDFIVTAHHLNDSLETFLINLSRGTGLQGLQGIPLQNHCLFRPLCNISKEKIKTFAKENRVQWREDSSNQSNEYLRNKIRHHVVPSLTELNPQFLDNFNQTIQYLQGEQTIIQNHLLEVKSSLFQAIENEIHISIDELKKLNPIATYLFHLFGEFGFAHPIEIQKLINGKSSAEIQSPTHRLIKNRNKLILTQLSNEDFFREFIIDEERILKNPLNLVFSKSNEKKIDALETLDFSEIQFPIKIRKPKIGDEFRPLGLNGSKKLSKFFKDLKLSKTEKENIWILVDNSDQILYVIGHRIDERFKIKKNTHKFLNIYLC